MGRLGTFVPRLAVLTVLWLLATTALTYAAAQKSASAPAAPTTAATTPAAQQLLTVPDVRRQAYTFAKGTLTDAGFAWRVAGAVPGYASNTVVTQNPAPGTQVVDTGAPTIVLTLAKSGAQVGVPEAASPVAGTRVKLAGLASADVAVAKAPKAAKAAPKKAAPKQAAPKQAAPKKAAPAKKAAAKLPKQKAPAQRPPAFVVPGARREPLDEMPLPARAKALLRWLAKDPQPSNANVKYWLYQHAWVVSGAEMGWWHGAEALQTLVQADNKVWQLWGIGARSEGIAKRALAEVEARTR